MAGFTFKLEPVLKARLAEEQQKQIAVAEMERKRMQIEQSIRRRQQLLAASKSELKSALTGQVNTRDLAGTAASSMRLMGQAQKLVLELAAVHQHLGAARTELIEATRRRRAVELLRERRLGEWKREQNRIENAFLDEIAARHSRVGLRIDDRVA